jgi:hypothetical protein
MVLGHLLFKKDHLVVKGGPNPDPRHPYLILLINIRRLM